jgi:protein-disulfide isomerase
VAPDWRKYVDSGHVIVASNTANAPHLVEFLDYQCPACQEMWRRTGKLIAANPGRLNVEIHYLPSSAHPLAMPAALAAECAAQQARFADYNRALFESSSLSGEPSWTKIALSSHVPDSTRFNSCVRDSIPLPTIRADLSTAQHFGARGTPVWLLDGELYEGLPWDFERIVTQRLKAE